MVSVFNLNIQHGRNRESSVWPPRVGREEMQRNLEQIVDCILEHKPDIVTLQEVDEYSILSGSFNQFEFLAARLRYPYTYFAASCSMRRIFVSGNAIFSKYPLENCAAHKFNNSFPTERMGFVIADAVLPEGKRIAVTSVHIVWIDWTRPHSREKQLEELQRIVAARKASVIIVGDLNADLLGKEISLQPFIQALDLSVYEPESPDMNTYHSANLYERTDWILVSKDIRFIFHKTIAEKLSDHLAVFAELSYDNDRMNA